MQNQEKEQSNIVKIGIFTVLFSSKSPAVSGALFRVSASFPDKRLDRTKTEHNRPIRRYAVCELKIPRQINQETDNNRNNSALRQRGEQGAKSSCFILKTKRKISDITSC